jgi:hypothetical protein
MSHDDVTLLRIRTPPPDELFDEVTPCLTPLRARTSQNDPFVDTEEVPKFYEDLQRKNRVAACRFICTVSMVVLIAVVAYIIFRE